MFIIGITGGTGAGKTTVLRALQKLGTQTLDCDELYHELLLSSADMRAELETRFSDVVTDGKIDRRKLGKIVWNDPVALGDLNMITHKYMDDEIDRRIYFFRTQGNKFMAIDAIALIEGGQGNKCDVVIGVIAPKLKRLARIMDRDHLSREQAQKRVHVQQPERFYRENCDYVLENIYDTQAEFEKICVEFFAEMIKEKCS